MAEIDFQVGMSNADLSDAIAMAFAMIGRTTETDFRHHAAKRHLSDLFDVQLRRAKLAAAKEPQS